MPSPTFTGEYATDGKQDRAKVREESGYRCIRCGHPYQTGLKRADRGEWSACDEKCAHKGAIRVRRGRTWIEIEAKASAGTWVKSGDSVQAHWRILTVHHFDGCKSNDAWWNKLSLCQKCHLSFQTRVNPEIPWMFEHSDWIKPFVCGFYAKKYLGLDLTRKEVMDRLEELLFLERKA